MQLNELAAKVVAMEEVNEAMNNMTASTVAAINHMAGSVVTAPPGIRPTIVDLAAPAPTQTTQQQHQTRQGVASSHPVPNTPVQVSSPFNNANLPTVDSIDQPAPQVQATATVDPWAGADPWIQNRQPVTRPLP